VALCASATVDPKSNAATAKIACIFIVRAPINKEPAIHTRALGGVHSDMLIFTRPRSIEHFSVK
jgi:hypothetical protein